MRDRIAAHYPGLPFTDSMMIQMQIGRWSYWQDYLSLERLSLAFAQCQPFDAYSDGSARQVHFVSSNGDRTRSLENHAVVLEEGSLFYSVSNIVVSPASDTARPSVPDHSGAVTGGTGAFSCAHGTVDIRFDGTRIEYMFEIVCD